MNPIRRALLFALVSVLFTSALSGDTGLDPLAHQATVKTTAGKTYRGWLDGFRHDRIRLRQTSGQGEVIYQFSPDEVSALIFPQALEADETVLAGESNLTDEIMESLDRIWAERIPYLPALDPANRAPLLFFAEALLAVDRPLEAVARARRLRAIDLSQAEAERMSVVVLKGFEEAGLYEETTALAEEWCLGHDPAGSSALGWAVLARQALRNESWDEALWLGLHPVAFGYDDGASELNQCYAAAIAAALKLGDAGEAATLYNEMRRRGLTWPVDQPRLAEAETLIAAALAEPNEGGAVELPDKAGGPPVPDSWLTLEAIRRVLAKSGN